MKKKEVDKYRKVDKGLADYCNACATSLYTCAISLIDFFFLRPCCYNFDDTRNSSGDTTFFNDLNGVKRVSRIQFLRLVSKKNVSFPVDIFYYALSFLINTLITFLSGLQEERKTPRKAVRMTRRKRSFLV